MKIRNDQENRMNEALSNPVLSRNPTALRQVQEQNISLISQTDKDIAAEKETHGKYVKETMDMDKKILDAKVDNSKTKDIITFKFVADAFGTDLNTTVKWFIVVIIAVFDPLAVCLILAYNVSLLNKKKEEVELPPTKKMDVQKSEPESKPNSEAADVVPTEEPKKILLNEIPVQVDQIQPQNQPLRDNEMLHTPSPEPIRR